MTWVEQCIVNQTLQAINAQLDTTIGLIKCHTAQKKTVFQPINQQEPANKSLQQQKPFFITRKRRKASSIRKAKPTTNDKLMNALTVQNPRYNCDLGNKND